MAPDLTRFHARHAEGWHTIALQELQAGRKRSHWIWWLFPQLDGLGRSPLAQRYAFEDDDEARADLVDPVLCAHLQAAIQAVVDQLAEDADLARRMGSGIDARKLVSSMTLFSLVADQSDPLESPRGALADTILAAASAQGLGRCAYTRDALGL